MGLSTHVLDTMHGCPASGMKIWLYIVHDNTLRLIKSEILNQDGRTGIPLMTNDSLQVGVYRLVFDVKSYFLSKLVVLPDPAFIDQVPIEFGIANSHQHYHVPLLVSPWSYSTYRGS